MTAFEQHEQKTGSFDFDAIVIGAGFSGLYMLHRLRDAGFSTRVYEAGKDVGGVWYWNRYPGARCDIDSIYYNYTFSDELIQEWTWSQRYADQPEILRYLNYVADKFELRRDIQFETLVNAAHYDDQSKRWHIHLHDESRVSARFFIAAVGCLSASNIPNFKGLDQFQGESYHTGRWPHEEVSFKGKRVGVIGTGSSGIQSIPVIAEEADHLTVFQRSPQYSTPAHNHLYDDEFIKKTKENYDEMRREMRESRGGFLSPFSRNEERSALEDTPEERKQVYERAYGKGGYTTLLNTYNDLSINKKANDTLSEFLQSKIRKKVHDPNVAEKLMPTYPYGGKRVILDTNYYETYNRTNVTLVDVGNAPIEEITRTGLRTKEEEYDLDMLIFATGYDAMTGPLFKIDIRGKDSVALKEKWDEGRETRTYLGLTTAQFPNFFMITGPESPSVLSNMPVSIEQHVEWISDCLEYMRTYGYETIEANEEAEKAWSTHCKEVAAPTLIAQTDSWYTGANIEGKARGIPIYLGGVGTYRKICSDVAVKGYEGFTLV